MSISEKFAQASKAVQERMLELCRSPASGGDVIVQLNMITMELGLSVKQEQTMRGPAHSPTWSFTLNIGVQKFTGEAPALQQAKMLASVQALEWLKNSMNVKPTYDLTLVESLLSAVINSGTGGDWLEAISELWNKLMHSANGNPVNVPAILATKKLQAADPHITPEVLWACLTEAQSTHELIVLGDGDFPHFPFNMMQYQPNMRAHYCAYLADCMRFTNDDWTVVLASMRNRIMHAVNGNSVRTPEPPGSSFATCALIRTVAPKRYTQDFRCFSTAIIAPDSPTPDICNMVKLIELSPSHAGECEISIQGGGFTNASDGYVAAYGVSIVRANDWTKTYPILVNPMPNTTISGTLLWGCGDDNTLVDSMAVRYSGVYLDFPLLTGPKLVNIVDPKHGDWLVYWSIRADATVAPPGLYVTVRFRSSTVGPELAVRKTENQLEAERPPAKVYRTISNKVTNDGDLHARAEGHNAAMHALNGNQYANNSRAMASQKHKLGKRKDEQAKFFKDMARRGIKGQPATYVMQMLDPYHDTPFDPVGVPDDNTQRSLIEMVVGQQTIVAPAGLVEGNTWDCHITASSVFSNIPYDAVPNNTPAIDVLPLSGDTMLMGTVVTSDPVSDSMIMEANTAAGLFTGMAHCPVGICVMTTGTGSPTTGPNIHDDPLFSTTCADIDTEFMFGDHRIVGMAFEVANTTPPLYQGGAVTTYRQPYKWSKDPKTTTYASNVNMKSYDSVELQKVPEVVNDATRMVDSLTWEAKHGVYAVLRPSGVPELHQPSLACLSRVPVVEQALKEQIAETTCGVVAMKNVAGVFKTVPVTYSVGRFDASGAYFTGLSSQTTMTLTWRVIVEHVPNPTLGADATFIRLARKPPGYNAKALQVAASLGAKLPVACKLNDNYFGEWFDSVCATLQTVLPVLGAAVGQPGAGEGIARAVGVAGKVNKLVREAKQVVKVEKKVVKEIKAAKAVAAKPYVRK